MKKNFDAIVIGSVQSGPFLAAWPEMEEVATEKK